MVVQRLFQEVLSLPLLEKVGKTVGSDDTVGESVRGQKLELGDPTDA